MSNQIVKLKYLNIYIYIFKIKLSRNATEGLFHVRARRLERIWHLSKTADVSNMKFLRITCTLICKLNFCTHTCPYTIEPREYTTT